MSRRRNRGRCEKCKRRPQGHANNLVMTLFMTGYKYLTRWPWRQPICIKMKVCADCRAGK